MSALNTQPQTQRSGGDELDIQTMIKMLEIIKPLTDHLREITSHHDTNGMNSLIISALLPFIHERERAARIDERENMKFIDTKTGEETFIPFTQYRYTSDGLLLNWEHRSQQLKPQAAEGGEA